MLRPRRVRLGLLIFISSIAVGNLLTAASAVKAVFIFTALLMIFINIFGLKKNLSLIIFLSIAMFGLLRSAAVPKNSEIPQVFDAKVLSDSVSTTYGSQIVIGSPIGGRLKVGLPRYPEFETGDHVRITVKKIYPGNSFVAATAEFLDSGEVNGVINVLNGIKRKFVAGLAAVLPEPYSSFVAGTVIGGSASLPEDIKDNFRTSGLSHILSASGYNFSLLLAFLAYLLRPLALRRQVLIFIFLIPSFAVIAGYSPAVLRAAVMAGFVSQAKLFGRGSLPGTDPF